MERIIMAPRGGLPAALNSHTVGGEAVPSPFCIQSSDGPNLRVTTGAKCASCIPFTQFLKGHKCARERPANVELDG